MSTGAGVVGPPWRWMGSISHMYPDVAIFEVPCGAPHLVHQVVTSE